MISSDSHNLKNFILERSFNDTDDPLYEAIFLCPKILNCVQNFDFFHLIQTNTF